MKKQVCTSLLWMVVVIATFIYPGMTSAQSNAGCGTLESDQNSTFELLTRRSTWNKQTQFNSINFVPLKFHIIGAINGAFAIDSFLVFDELERVNNAYQSAGIQFQHCGNINYILDNSYLTFIKNVDEDLCDREDIEGVINIYFVPVLERENGENLCGYAYNYDNKPRVLMDNGCSTNGSTLAHELGHSFSLLHTHSTSGGLELVDGSNCQFAGDRLCDTPADPRLSSDNVNGSCEYVGDELDPTNTPYKPDTRNIMSYSRKNCRLHFSNEQFNQMINYHDTYSFLLNCIDDSVSSLNQISKLGSTTISPNPASSHVFLKHIPENTTIYIFTIEGRLLRTINIDTPLESFEYSLTGFDSGIYLIQINRGNDMRTCKLIKH